MARALSARAFTPDIYRRDNGRWKFVERHAQFYRFVPLSKGWGWA